MESKEMTATRKESVIGLVSNCANLRVRKEPDDKAEVLGTIPVDTEVMIEEDEPSSEFYKGSYRLWVRRLLYETVHHGLNEEGGPRWKRAYQAY